MANIDSVKLLYGAGGAGLETIEIPSEAVEEEIYADGTVTIYIDYHKLKQLMEKNK